MKSIYLTGFMGAGKTTIGQSLAQRLDLPVYDTDSVIEQKMEIIIKDIFEQYGERHFRELETKTLQDIPVNNAIVTTGGGIVTSQSNIDWMKENGCMIFLHADPEVIWSRLESDITRPLVQQREKEEVLELFKSRLPLYRQAHLTVDTTGLTLEEATESVHKAIKIWNNSQH
ncbi:shikimate kinase [Bacillus sp. LL01]|uniref:shikimate kinase n=1 Tax=Bacillus sp. LL01 TaxID=1665556 RepID=UPI00064D2FFA|nr:shikimate kinase [Bacillus sp. LL01]KMJ60077.1 shikimate kinase [Bacillus sp. LL01]